MHNGNFLLKQLYCLFYVNNVLKPAKFIKKTSYILIQIFTLLEYWFDT